MPPPVSRVEAVQALRALAAKYGVDIVPDRASRARVGTMVDELLAVETLSVESVSLYLVMYHMSVQARKPTRLARAPKKNDTQHDELK